MLSFTLWPLNPEERGQQYIWNMKFCNIQKSVWALWTRENLKPHQQTNPNCGASPASHFTNWSISDTWYHLQNTRVALSWPYLRDFRHLAITILNMMKERGWAHSYASLFKIPIRVLVRFKSKSDSFISLSLFLLLCCWVHLQLLALSRPSVPTLHSVRSFMDRGVIKLSEIKYNSIKFFWCWQVTLRPRKV